MHKVLSEHKDFKEVVDPLVRKVHKVREVLKVFKEDKVLKDQQVDKVHKDLHQRALKVL